MLSVTCNFPHRDDASHLQSFADVDHPSKMTSPTLFEQLTTKQDLILYPSPLQPFLIPSICCVCVCVCVWCVCVLSKSLPRSNSLSISSSAIPDLLNLIGCLLHTCMCVLLPNSLQLHGCMCVCVFVCLSPTLCNAMDCCVAQQAPLSMEFARLTYPTPGDLSDPGMESVSPASPALAGRFFTIAPCLPPLGRCYFSIVSSVNMAWNCLYFFC